MFFADGVFSLKENQDSIQNQFTQLIWVVKGIFLCGKDVSKYKQNSCVNQIFDHLKACILTFLSFIPII